LIERIYSIRGLIGGAGFILVWLFSRDTRFFPALFFHFLGVSIRFISAGYIGKHYRDKKIKADKKINKGIYRYLRHPLYIGNLFLVIGTLSLYAPPFWIWSSIILVFIFIYTLFSLKEERFLKTLPETPANFEIKNTLLEKSTWFIVGFLYVLAYLRRFFLTF